MVQLRNNFYMIPVDSDWSEFEFNESAPNLLMFCTRDYIKHITLPPGQWELISFGNQVSKKEAAKIVESNFCRGGRLGDEPDLRSHIEILHSLITSFGENPEMVVIVHKMN